MEFDRDSSWNLRDGLGHSFEQDVDAVQTDVIRVGDLVAFAGIARHSAGWASLDEAGHGFLPPAHRSHHASLSERGCRWVGVEAATKAGGAVAME